jgi:RHS repeat-associated protein
MNPGAPRERSDFFARRTDAPQKVRPSRRVACATVLGLCALLAARAAAQTPTPLPTSTPAYTATPLACADIGGVDAGDTCTLSTTFACSSNTTITVPGSLIICAGLNDPVAACTGPGAIRCDGVNGSSTVPGGAGSSLALTVGADLTAAGTISACGGVGGAGSAGFGGGHGGTAGGVGGAITLTVAGNLSLSGIVLASGGAGGAGGPAWIYGAGGAGGAGASGGAVSISANLAYTQVSSGVINVSGGAGAAGYAGAGNGGGGNGATGGPGGTTTIFSCHTAIDGVIGAGGGSGGSGGTGSGSGNGGSNGSGGDGGSITERSGTDLVLSVATSTVQSVQGGSEGFPGNGGGMGQPGTDTGTPGSGGTITLDRCAAFSILGEPDSTLLTNGGAGGPGEADGAAGTVVHLTDAPCCNLILAPSSAGPDVAGTTQTLTATLTDITGTPLNGVTVQFTVTGPNATTGGASTDANGNATFTYSGETAGTDTVQAFIENPFSLMSNTATVLWITPVGPVVSTAVQGTFFAESTSYYSFVAQPGDTPAFSQSFPTINFNPPSGTVNHNISGVGPMTRPFTDVIVDPAGNFMGTIVAQGNGLRAGVGTLNGFDAVFTGTLIVAAAGDVTINVQSDDGFLLGVGGGASRVAGPWVNPTADGLSPFHSYPLVAAFNQGTPPRIFPVTVHFPTAGSYPYELDYFECCGGQLTLTMTVGNSALPAATTLTLSPSTPAAATVGSTQTITVHALDGSGQAAPGVAVTLAIFGANAQELSGTTDTSGAATLTYIGTHAGTDIAQAGAFVSGLPSASNSLTITWTIPGGGTSDQAPPSISAPAPADGAIVTKRVPISATFAPAAGQTITSWSVSYQGAHEATPVVIASGTGEPPAVLGTFDPTVLINDTYTIIISATASGGGVQTVTTTVSVQGNLKLGRYVTTYKDVSVPVQGFQMEVLRIYDSNDKRVGDFGVGWHVSMSNFRVATGRALGDGGWSEYPTQCTILGCFYDFASSAVHAVTVTYPDGHQEIFDFTPDGGVAALYWIGTAKFTKRPGTGTTSTLEVDASTYSTSVFSGFDGTLRASIGGPIYNPTRFKLTTRAGQVLILDVNDGLRSMTDLNNNSLSIDAAGIHASNGESLTFIRDAGNRITHIIEPINAPNNYTVDYTYTPAGDLDTVAYPNGTVYQYEYGADHNLQNASEPGQLPFSIVEYYADGRIKAVTDADGYRTAIENDVAGQQQISYSPSGHTETIDTFDDRGNLLQRQVLGLDAEGNPQTVTTSATYNARDQQTSFTEQLTFTDPPLSRTSSSTYDDNTGDLLSSTDFNGNTRCYAYTDKGFLEQEFPPTAAHVCDTIPERVYHYDPTNGNLLRVERRDLSAWTFDYFPDGNLMTMTDPGGRPFGFNYDALGHLTTITDALHQTHVTIDAMGRVTDVWNPLFLTDVWNAQLPHTHRDYDANGNLTLVSNALQHPRSYTYNAFDQVQTMTDALNQTATNTYNASTGAGRLENRLDRNGDRITYQYNLDGQLATKTLPGNDVTTYEYDGLGHLKRATNASAVMTFTYYADGSLHTETTEGTAGVPRPTVTHTYTYDNSGKRSSVSGPEGTLEYTYYDTNDLLHTLTDYAGEEFVFTYDALNRLTLVERPNPVTDALNYTASDDLRSRDASVPGPSGTPTPVARAEYTYDETGWRHTLTDLDGLHTYTPDAAGQLTAATRPPASGLANESYSYDLAGNRAGACGPNSYNANEQLLCDASYTYTYDNEGNMLSRTLRSNPTVVTGYAWDAEHHLREVVLPDGSHVTYRYDPLGNRIEIGHGSDITRYVYDGSAISAEYDGNNALVATYVETPALNPVLEKVNSGKSTALIDMASAVVARASTSILEMERGGQRYFHIVDGLGSVTAITDINSAMVERDRYAAYGNLAPNGSVGNPFLFTGVLHDATTGLYLMPLRAYDPTIGRFLSEDPLPSVNPYPYASNNPVNLTDPSGAGDLAEYGELTAQDFIGKFCRASILAEFPSELLLYTVAEILEGVEGIEIAKVNKALKLLKQKRFRKVC